MTFSEDYPDYKITGSSADLNVAVGVMVFPSIALHTTAFGWITDEPDVDFGHYYVEIGNDFKMTALGLGVTYYLLPAKLFASGSVGAAWVSSDEIDTDAGLAFDVFLGKEWTVMDHLMLGIGAGLNYHSIRHDFGLTLDPSGGSDWRWSGISGALRFLLTYR
jgi:hypothetical protein